MEREKERERERGPFITDNGHAKMLPLPPRITTREGEGGGV